MREKINTKWLVGHSLSKDELPAEMVEAAIPGAVQLDWAKAKGWDSYTYADNWKDYEWMEDRYWTYTTIIPDERLCKNDKLFFVSKGIDYQFRVLIDEEIIHKQEGMFTPFEIDLTKMEKGGSKLVIQVFPAPKRKDAPKGRDEADQSCKPAVSYGWDWHPRLIPLGIWNDTYFEVRKENHIRKSEVTYQLNHDLNSADVTLDLSLSKNELTTVIWSLYDRDGDKVFEKEIKVKDENLSIEYTLNKPKLWWPNGEGEAYLYTSCVRAYNEEESLLDEVVSKVGFRQVQLVMHPGAWQSPKGHPITRSNPPITLEINGRSIFCKGVNWVNPEIFPGIITKDTYLPLLNLAKEAHFNMLRSWGGGIINKDEFFELCDELGLMVWQEFPLACNNYEDTPHYLEILDQESKSIIQNLRKYACVVLWCGGNELFNAWSKMTDQSLALRLLNRNCFDLDPKTPFLMTSPIMGMAHGNYLFRYQDGQEVFQVMPKASNTAYTECGCQGPSSAEYLKTFIPEDELFPPRPGTVWETHHAFGAWVDDTWLCPKTLELYFGKAETLEELVEWGQLLQSEGYKCIYEEARRQKPVNSMILNWCYNEPWPTAANCSLINWPAEPKPAYYAVKNSCRPVLASARIPKFTFKAGELFSVELWMLNDSPEVVPAGCIEAYLLMDDETTSGTPCEPSLCSIKLTEWKYPPLAPGENMSGPNIRYILPKKNCSRITLKLKGAKELDIDSEYVLLYSE